MYTGRRKINFKSNDRDLVATCLRLLGRTNRIKEAVTRIGRTVYLTEFGDARLYRWFQSVGLTPRKSLTLGAIDVPDEFLSPLLRGLFEGDGTTQNFVHHPTRATYPSYTFERLWTFFASASRPHLEWVQSRVTSSYAIRGRIEEMPRPDRHEFFRLKFGNHESVKLLRIMYPDANVPKLERKWRVWDDYRRRHDLN